VWRPVPTTCRAAGGNSRSAHFVGVSFFLKLHKMLAHSKRKSHVLAAKDIAEAFEGKGQIDDKRETDREGGTKIVQVKKAGSTNRQSLSEIGYVDYELVA
jgi:hypothetical protein